MRIHIPHHNESRRLPKSIQEYLARRFNLSPEYLKMLKCFVYDGKAGEKPVKRVSIFDTGLTTENNILIRTREDLEKNPLMIAFEGYIDRQGNPYAADRRMPKKMNKVSKVKDKI